MQEWIYKPEGQSEERLKIKKDMLNNHRCDKCQEEFKQGAMIET